jgi:hypothetical protein
MAGTAMRKEQLSLEHVASQIASLQEVLNLTEEQVSSKEKISVNSGCSSEKMMASEIE